jgi:site-specific recombinase XerC
MPWLEVRLPRAVLSAREAEQVLALADVSTPLGLRDRAIMETLYSTGMRRMEVVQLGPYDVDTERGTVMIRQGKGKKDRMVPIGDRAVAWIKRYIQEVRPGLLVGNGGGGVLFLTNLGQAFHPAKPVGHKALAQQLGLNTSDCRGFVIAKNATTGQFVVENISGLNIGSGGTGMGMPQSLFDAIRQALLAAGS